MLLSFDIFFNFDKIKPNDFEQTVTDNGNTGGEVRSSIIQTKGLKNN